jgi:hypothetical protein
MVLRLHQNYGVTFTQLYHPQAVIDTMDAARALRGRVAAEGPNLFRNSDVCWRGQADLDRLFQSLVDSEEFASDEIIPAVAAVAQCRLIVHLGLYFSFFEWFCESPFFSLATFKF